MSKISRKGVGRLYIPEFVCGIGATVIAEVFILGLYVMLGLEDKKGKK